MCEEWFSFYGCLVDTPGSTLLAFELKAENVDDGVNFNRMCD